MHTHPKKVDHRRVKIGRHDESHNLLRKADSSRFVMSFCNSCIFNSEQVDRCSH